MPSLAFGCGKAGCPSGQWERAVNPSVNAFEGSNPSPATTFAGPILPGTWLSEAPCLNAHVFVVKSGFLAGFTTKTCAPSDRLAMRAIRQTGQVDQVDQPDQTGQVDQVDRVSHPALVKWVANSC